MLTPDAIFVRQGNSSTQILRTPTVVAVADRDGQLVLGDSPVPLRPIDFRFQLPPRSGRAFEVSSARSGLLWTVDQRSSEDSGPVVLVPAPALPEQVFRFWSIGRLTTPMR